VTERSSGGTRCGESGDAQKRVPPLPALGVAHLLVAAADQAGHETRNGGLEPPRRLESPAVASDPLRQSAVP